MQRAEPQPEPPSGYTMSVKLSIFLPLQHRQFRHLWVASLLSNLGSLGQIFAVGWHITALSKSVLLSSLVQTIIWMPVLLFVLPAGMLADAINKPKLLLISNTVLGVTALALGLLSMANFVSAVLLLSLMFITGIGNAFTLPAWQASMSELVPSEQVIAVASLNNLSYNLAACIGPCIGGWVYLNMGPAPLYLFNALSFCGLLYLYYQWQSRLPKKSAAGLNQRLSNLPMRAAALSSAWNNPAYRRLLLYSFFIFCLSNAFAALLPSLIRAIAAANAYEYGLRIGALGAGAVLAVLILPKLRRVLAERHLLSLSLCVFALMLSLLAITHELMPHLSLIICGGVAWSGIVTSLNGAALRAFPISMRARSLSLYILVTAAGQAAGGALWGALSNRFGVNAMMIAAGLAMLACAAFVFVSNDFLEQA
jgi:MFS family permease